MTTVTKVVSVKEGIDGCFFFETKTITLVVESFKDGVCRVSGLAGDFAKDVIWTACGCFLKHSNFEKKLQKAFHTDEPLTTIEADLNDELAVITTKCHEPLPIFQVWKEKAMKHLH